MPILRPKCRKNAEMPKKFRHTNAYKMYLHPVRIHVLVLRTDARKKAPQSAAARWTGDGDSPCAAQTQPPLTNPGRPAYSGRIDASAESSCATLHQGVSCAQRQDVVVAHQPDSGVYFLNQFTPARERECRQLDCKLEAYDNSRIYLPPARQLK